MLERASTCLETGGRQLFKSSQPCLRTRRMLHASFWHHGASDLLLPVWWASSTLDYSTGDVDDRPRPSPTPRCYDAPLLDFLYPEKTLALIRRLSTYSPDVVDARRRPFTVSGFRQFSTSRWQPQEEEDIDDLEVAQAKEELEQLLGDSNADDALETILRTKKAGKQELAWLLYYSLPYDSRTTHMHSELLNYFAAGDAPRTASRSLQIFDAIESEARSPSSYRIAISAYVHLRQTGKAIQLHEEAAARLDTTDIGTDVILKLTVHNYQWDLSLRVYRNFLRQAKRLGLGVEYWYHRRDKKQFAATWGQVAQYPDLIERYHSFLAHIQEFQHELNSTEHDKQVLALFVDGFVPLVMDQVINAPEPDEDYEWDFFENLFRDLESLGVPTRLLYEYSIVRMIDTPRHREFTNKRHHKIWNHLYLLFREKTGHKPSRYLISRLLVHHGEKDSIRRVDELVQDLRTFYPKNPFTPDALTYVIRFHAKRGESARVHEYFSEFQTRFPGSVTVSIISSLIYVHARRIDVPGAVHQFKRINGEFGLIPDIGCWNTLLLAFTRADDLDGALECFNTCLDSGVTPDIYTFGPMLDLCAERGDVEAFEALFSRAKLLNIPVDTDRRARSGYVQAFLNAGDPEGAEAIAEGMHKSWLAGTLRGDSLTHTWNLLISYHAVQGDLVSSRRVYKEMMEKSIHMDTWTYASLMRSLIAAKQTNAAWKVVRVTMPKNRVPVHAFHYAIVITGFLLESQHNHAQAVYKEMRRREIPQTDSSRQASILVTGVQELRQLKEKRVTDPQTRLKAVEERLRESILADYGAEIANDQPSHHRYIDTPELNNVPQGYFALVIMLYSARGALEICKQLFEAASKATSEQDNFRAPITLLSAIMETHYLAEEYDEVEKCWEIARAEANRLVKTLTQVINPAPPAEEFGSITDPSLQKRFHAARIAVNRRQILFKATRTYMRSLCAQDNPQAIQKAQSTVLDLLSNGFILDNLTWNEYIQNLALRGHMLDAFSACEMYLMPEFPGWAKINPAYIHKDRPGYEWQQLKHYEIRKQSVIPRYKTLVVLAAAYSQVRRDEQNGLGYNAEMGGWARDVLEQIAPLTCRAIDTMPRTGDDLQNKYLYDI
jgi:pentatricopeptide repeat-containing protein PET309